MNERQYVSTAHCFETITIFWWKTLAICVHLHDRQIKVAAKEHDDNEQQVSE